MKKTLAILIAVLLVFGSFCGAFAGSVSVTERKEKPEPLKEVYSGTCGANLYWELDSETGVLEITGTGDMDNWTYYSHSPWRGYNTDFKTVLIGEGVTSIGDYAFDFCREIISVDIPGSVTSIGEGAFCDCVSLAYVIIPDGVTSIGAWAFCNCTSLAYATIPGSVTSIGESAFIGCTSLAAAAFLGEPPSSFDTRVFDGCAVDFCIHCTEDYASYWAPNGETEWNGYPIVMQLSSAEALVCGNDLIAYFDFLTGELRIEGSGDMYDYDDDEHVPWRYYRPGILSVTIENGATGIGDHAFSNSALLTSVTISDSVTRIGLFAFCNCSSLTSVTIPDSVTSIDYAAFYYCSSLTSVTIPDSVTSIGHLSFQSCEALTSVSIGSGVTSIGDYAFEGCAALASVSIGSGVTSIGEYAFEGCAALTSINIPCGVTDIGMQALSNCSSLAAITVDPNNQTYSSVDGVLFNKEQTELICCPGGKTGDYTVPDGVWKIDVFAFRGCSLLTSVTFPESVTWIGGDGAFEGCSSLSSATFCGEAPSYFGTDAFSGCAPGFYICYYPGYTYSWSPNGETEWNGYPIMVLWDAPFVCGDDLRAYFDPMTGELRIEGSGYMYDYYEPEQTPWYCYRDRIGSVTIENGATWIGCYAFYECSWLSSVVIPESVVHIGEHAFANCGSLTSMTFPDSVSSIGEYAFENCGALASVAFGGNLWSISDHAFENCYSLTSVTIPESVSSIGESAFENCGALAALTLGSNVTSIGARAFHYCGSLTSVTFPGSVWSMGEEAFSGCYSLASVTFCAEPPSSFGSYLFSGADPEFCIYYYFDYAYSWSPNGETEWHGYPIRMIGGTVAEPGDLDGDGIISMSDVTTLSMFLNGEDPEISSSGLQAADANGDGTVDIRDIAAIYQKIAQS